MNGSIVTTTIPGEVPRLTATLRETCFPTPTSNSTSDQLCCERDQLWKALKGQSASVQHLLGSKASCAPREAQEACDRFARSVSDAVGSLPAGGLLAGKLEAAYAALLGGGQGSLDKLAQSLGATPSPAAFDGIQHAFTAVCRARVSLGLPAAIAVASEAGGALRQLPDGEPARWEPLSPRSAVLRVCDPDGKLHSALPPPAPASSRRSASRSTWHMGEQTVQGAPPPEESRAFTPDPDSDDEAIGVRQRHVSLTWLERTVCGVTGQSPPRRGGDDSTLLLIVQALAGPGGGDAVASEILEVLGFQHVEEVSRIVSARAGILKSLAKAVEAVRAADAASANKDRSNISLTVKLSTASQKAVEKMERKAARKAKGKVGHARVPLGDLDYACTVGWAAIQDTEVDYSNVLTIGGVDIAIGDASSSKKALPAGTTREAYKGYEEVRVPAIDAAKLLPPAELVSIDAIEEWARPAFAGYTALNRIQSRIFQVGYYSNENMLVCAPTGAGKTNIAMVAVLREVGLHIKGGFLQKGSFKIVYVAPMKALAGEVTRTFGQRLAQLGINVRELTGDMQLSKAEMAATQMIVTTPEKWDVITRKGGDVATSALVRLLILDEVHLLNDERGPVIETLVARTLRQVETSQTMIRIVGLSATLPNHQDVGAFLGVGPAGLFHFGPEYRPVPLKMAFVGVSEKNAMRRNLLMGEITYEKVAASLEAGNQCMVFVHSRKDTAKTAEQLASWAASNGQAELFAPDESHPQIGLVRKDVARSRNGQLRDLFKSGFGIHHAGMLRSDRNLAERLFSDGFIKVLCCTATLAWGVNLPAHTVIIKGTQVYDANKGRFTDLGVLDVQQIFGRAGRPQFDTHGEAAIITQHDRLAKYLGMLTSATPIESRLVANLPDNLNAEVVLGTVASVADALAWLSYSYLHVRLAKNPLAYGVTMESLAADPTLEHHRRKLITDAAHVLETCKMARFEARTGNIYRTDLGRIASHFYIRAATISTVNEKLKSAMSYAEIFHLIGCCSEFESMQVRDEEVPELEALRDRYCECDVKEALSSREGKVQVLLQVYISHGKVESFSLIADMLYVGDNAPRIARALFEVALRNQWVSLIHDLLKVCKMVERRLWDTEHPLRQIPYALDDPLLGKLEAMGLSVDRLSEMPAGEISAMLRLPAAGAKVKDALAALPRVTVECSLAPITRTVLRVSCALRPEFAWRERVHGAVMRWMLWVEDTENDVVYHHEMWMLTRKMMGEAVHRLDFTIPIFEPLPAHHIVVLEALDWLCAGTHALLSLRNLILPGAAQVHTELLDLEPLPRSALHSAAFEAMYAGRFSHFNPIQTQAFHTLYHTDENVLLAAPTGSGKTISSELAILRVFAQQPRDKVLYIAPLKALVRERVREWRRGLCAALGKRLAELTGDHTPDLAALLAADVIISTPEKWDGISRSWQGRGYVRMVSLVVIDEIHLLGSERGAVLEAIVSRMRFVAERFGRAIRFVGLSTALANPQDLAAWLGINQAGLFNFRPAVRPVPLEAHIQGFPGKFYCPRMATMNKPAYAAIQSYSPVKPVLVFVSSRRQTRLTALDLMAFAAADMRPSQWLHMPSEALEEALALAADPNLRHTLQFGIGLHHAGLSERDRELVERLFCKQHIQVLVATSTLAWGVNMPAHLVIIKGTEYFDAPTRRYVDYPITDVLQMMGRAGRPQFDTSAKAVIMVHEPKKGFYKKFLYEPFPVESALPAALPDTLNAEVASGTVTCKQDAVAYLTWTFFFQRLPMNPAYYGLGDTSPEGISKHLSGMVQDAVLQLQGAGCIDTDEEDNVSPTPAGKIASMYYLSYQTMDLFVNSMCEGSTFKQLLQIASSAAEFDELPVRHNEDILNAALSDDVRWRVDPGLCGEPHTKANLLLQAHFSRLPLPIADYATDTRTVLDNMMRLLQAMIDVATGAGWLKAAITCIHIMQAVLQGHWPDLPALMTLEAITEDVERKLAAKGLGNLAHTLRMFHEKRHHVFQAFDDVLGKEESAGCMATVSRLPHLLATCQWSGSPGKERCLIVTLQRSIEAGQRKSGRNHRSHAVAPRYPKMKDEGWFVLLGSSRTDSLVSLRRSGARPGGAVSLRMDVPPKAISGMTALDVYILSDAYVGLDQVAHLAIEDNTAPVQATPWLDGVRGLD